jgi:hypothetical protein
MYQKITRGFSDEDTWSLDCTFSKFVLPRLERFKEITTGFPAELETFEEWAEILDKMIEAHRVIADDEIYFAGSERSESVTEGLELFVKYYHSLWW